MGVSWRDYLDIMTTRARVLPWLPGITSAGALTQIDALINGYSRHVSNELDRMTVYRAHTAFFDVGSNFMSRLHLHAWPIGSHPTTGLPLVAIYNDASADPTYGADTLMDYPDTYRVYQDEEGQGRIQFLQYPSAGPQALKINWTGGMATKTTVEGTTATLANPGLFTLVDANATFITDQVEAGMTVTITAPAGAVCTRTILTVVSETQVNVTAAWPLAGAGNSWIVNEAGFVGQYPDIEQALIYQIVFHWQAKDKAAISSMGVSGGAGMNTTFTAFKPMEIQPELAKVIEHYRMVKYP